MANTYKNIVITPNRDTVANVVPSIGFSGGDVTTNTDITLRVYTASNGTLSFDGAAGQLFSITNDLTNTIFSVNDISGIPSIEVDANGLITFAEYGGNVAIGRANANYKLDVNGTINAASLLVLGNVGIGITSPQYSLDVANNFRILNTTSDAYMYIGEGTGLNQYGFLSWDRVKNNLEINTNGKDGIKIGANGQESILISEGRASIGFSNIEFRADQLVFSAALGNISARSQTIEFRTLAELFDPPNLGLDTSGNVLINRADSTVGQDVKLDVNGAVNASAVLVNGTPIESGITTGKAIAMAIVFG